MAGPTPTAVQNTSGIWRAATSVRKVETPSPRHAEMNPTKRLTIDQILAPSGPDRPMDKEAGLAIAWRLGLAYLTVSTALFCGLPAIGVNRPVTMIAVQMTIVAFGHCQMIVLHRQMRDTIIVKLRRYWQWDLLEADQPALELRLAHLRHPYNRSALLATIVLPAFALVAIVANGLHSVGVWKVPGWAVVSATSLLAMVLCWPLRRWEFQIRDRLANPICVRPT